MNSRIITTTSKIKREKKIQKRVKILLLLIILLFLIFYFVIGIIYNKGNFTITLDKNLYYERGLIIYDNPEYKVYREELLIKPPEMFNNISYRWLPNDLTEYNGSHNGDNYIAYSFYIENIGEETSDYWSEIVIEDSIKNVDEAVRVRVYKDKNYVTYAKMGKNGKSERDTTPFESNEIIATEHVENFKPGDVTKYTVVMWLEGNDPECNDNILGGEIKIYMAFNSELVENKKE